MTIEVGGQTNRCSMEFEIFLIFLLSLAQVGWIELPRSMNVSDSRALSFSLKHFGGPPRLSQATTGWESMATMVSAPPSFGCLVGSDTSPSTQLFVWKGLMSQSQESGNSDVFSPKNIN